MSLPFVLRDAKSGEAVSGAIPSLVIALGNFDGVHLAHAEIMKKAVSLANELSAEAAVWLFDVHPQTYLTGRTQELLSSPSERGCVAASFGVKYVVEARFSSLHGLEPEAFLQLLSDELNCVGAVCGFNYTFGVRGLGKARDVAAYFGAHSHILPPYENGGEVVSSSAIRALLTSGRIEKANEFLGRPYSICGKVIGGEKIGRTLGLPTANIALPKDRVLPLSGVYLSAVTVGEECYPAITNLGCKPTVRDDRSLLLETHLLDFSNDLYGRNICVSFLERIRDEKRFSSLDELKEAILKDKEYAKAAWERRSSLT